MKLSEGEWIKRWEIVRMMGNPMTQEKKGLRGGMRGAWCNHDYPIAVQVYDGGRRAQCLRCLAVGPVRSDPYAAQQALLEERAKRGQAVSP